MPGQREQAGEVLAFWFVESQPRQWFAKDSASAFDALLRERYLGLTRRAIAGELDARNTKPSGALPLFERFCDPRTADFARRHRDVIARFGCLPHRNAARGQVSGAEELAFLQTPGSRF